MSPDMPAMSDAVLAELERNATTRCDCGSCDGDPFGLTAAESLLVLTEVKRARASEKHLRATIADAAGAIGQDMERDEELARLRELEPYMREQIEQLAQTAEERKVREAVYRALAEEHQKRGDKLSAQLAERDERLAEIGETTVEWGMQWLGADSKPFGLHWTNQDESLQEYTRNHINGDGSAQLLHRLVGQPRVAEVEIVGDAPQGLNCWCPHDLMPDGRLVRDGVVAAGCPTHDVELEADRG